MTSWIGALQRNRHIAEREKEGKGASEDVKGTRGILHAIGGFLKKRRRAGGKLTTFPLFLKGFNFFYYFISFFPVFLEDACTERIDVHMYVCMHVCMYKAHSY